MQGTCWYGCEEGRTGMDRKFPRKREIAKDTTPRLLQYSHIVSVGKTNFQVKKRSTVRMGKQHIFLEARTALQSAVCLRELLLSLDPDSHMAEERGTTRTGGMGGRRRRNQWEGRRRHSEIRAYGFLRLPSFFPPSQKGSNWLNSEDPSYFAYSSLTQ